MSLEAASAPTPAESAAQTLASSWRVTLLRLSQYAFGFVSLLVTARALGPEGRAAYALPLTLSAIVATGVGLSFEQAVGRLLVKGAANVAQLSRLLAWSLVVLGTLGFAAAVGIGLATRTHLLAGADVASVVVAAVSVPLIIASQFSLGLLFRLGAHRAHGIIVAVSGGGQVIAMTILAFAGVLTPFFAVVVIVVGLAATAVPLVVTLRRYAGHGSLVPRTTRRLVAEAFAAAWPLHLASVSVLLNLRFDLLLVSLLLGTFETGVYSLAATLAESVLLVPYIVAVAAMPSQTRSSREEAARYTVDFSRQSFAIGVLVAVLAAATAYPLVRFLYGAEWIGSIVPLMILTLGVVAFAVEAPLRTYLIQSAAPKSILAAAATGMVVNIVLVMILTPAIGIVGAAVGSVASYWAYLALLLRLFQRTADLSARSIFAWPRQDDVLPHLWRRLRHSETPVRGGAPDA